MIVTKSFFGSKIKFKFFWCWDQKLFSSKSEGTYINDVTQRGGGPMRHKHIRIWASERGGEGQKSSNLRCIINNTWSLSCIHNDRIKPKKSEQQFKIDLNKSRV